jgi:hypothetical protein
MPPSNLSIVLSFSILLGLPPVTAAAEDEPAEPAAVAELAARELQLRAEIDERLRASVAELTEGEDSRLSTRTTELLLQQSIRVARQGGSSPPAKPALVDDRAVSRGR